jgi:hypothetical protein
MRGWIAALGFGSATIICGVPVVAESPRIEVASDGHEVAAVSGLDRAVSLIRDEAVTYAAAPDWQNALRVQVGGLQAADVDLDGDVDLVVGCYHSDSYPPYPDWENLIYLNTGAELEASPSWAVGRRAVDRRHPGGAHQRRPVP